MKNPRMSRELNFGGSFGFRMLFHVITPLIYFQCFVSPPESASQLQISPFHFFLLRDNHG